MTTLDVLILDDPDSRHADLVQDALSALGATSLRLNCADLGDWSVDIRPGKFRLRSVASEWEVSASTTVWYRRLGAPGVDDFDPDEAQLIRDEMPHVLVGGLVACGVRWVDEPFEVERAERKLFQLSTASRMRLAVPPSVVTDDSATAERMLKRVRIVAKPLSPGEGIAPYADEVHSGDLIGLDGLPILMQELVVDASADLRVVVVGTRAWTWRRPRTSGTIDWRAEDPNGASFDHVSPHTVEPEAVDLTSALGLTMSVQDWLETPDGVLFLEANPQGAWAFLNRVDEFIPNALAAHLREGSGQALACGVWPKPFRRVLWDLGRASKARENDGATAPQFAPPPWASVAARSSAALSVVRRANDEGKGWSEGSRGQSSPTRPDSTHSTRGGDSTHRVSVAVRTRAQPLAAPGARARRKRARVPRDRGIRSYRDRPSRVLSIRARPRPHKARITRSDRHGDRAGRDRQAPGQVERREQAHRSHASARMVHPGPGMPAGSGHRCGHLVGNRCLRVGCTLDANGRPRRELLRFLL